MDFNRYPVIDLVATGNNIKRLRLERGLTVRDLQSYFGFEEPQAIYKWQKGQSLPTVDNLYALGSLLGVSMDELIVVDIVVLSMSDGIVLEKKDTKITLATAISLIRAENAKTTARR